MSELVRHVGGQVSVECQAKRCGKEGCALTLKGIGRTRVIVDMDCKRLQLPDSAARCDCIYVGFHSEENWVAPIELKRGGVEASEVSRQVQGGATFAEKSLLYHEAEVRFRPIVAFGKIHRHQIQELKKKQHFVRFKNLLHEIKLMRCGSPLADALN